MNIKLPAGEIMGPFFATTSRLAVEPTHLLPSDYGGVLHLGVKRLRREADCSPLSSAEVKNAWSYTSTPPVSLHGVVLS